MSWGSRSSVSFWRIPRLPLVFLLSPTYLEKLYLLPLTSLLEFILSTRFPNLVLGCLHNFFVFLASYFFLLPFSTGFLLDFDFSSMQIWIFLPDLLFVGMHFS